MNFDGIKSFSDIQSALTNLFQKAGVDLKQPKSLFFNGRAGTLTVRATTNDLDMLEQIIMTMNIVPPQVTIKARFVEIDADNSGIDALIKKSLEPVMHFLRRKT
jgi:type II secretory pathway component HofQ